MLLYSNQDDIRVALQLKGSVLLSRKALLLGASVGGITLAVQFIIFFADDHLRPDLVNPYVMSTLGAIVSFSTIFRNNLAWQRYWEGLGQAHFMYSKWEDAFAQFAVFCRITIEAARKETDNASAVTKIDRVQSEYEHVVSLFDLLSALAVDRIAHGDTEIMDVRTAKAETPWVGHVMTDRELARSLDTTGAYELPMFHEGEYILSQHLENGAVAWKPHYNVARVPTDTEKDVLEKSEKRVSTAMTWIIASVSRITQDLAVPPPIISRIYQELSNGMSGFETCLKISNTPFPFAYAQLQVFLITAFSMLLPVYVACFTNSFIIGPIASSIIFASIYGINEVAKDMERPFGRDLNDIVLHDFHQHFIRLLAEMGPILDVDSIMHGSRRERHEERVSQFGADPAAMASMVATPTKSMKRPESVAEALFDQRPRPSVVLEGDEAELRPEGITSMARWLGDESPEARASRDKGRSPAQSPRDPNLW